MIDIFKYEYKKVIIECTDGRIFEGKVDWCQPSCDSDEGDDLLSINGIGLLSQEIKKITIIDN